MKNKNYKIKIWMILIIISFVFLIQFKINIINAENDGVDSGDGDDGCGIVCCSIHYDYAYKVTPKIKVTITDEKYKVLSQEGEWIPLKFIFYIETHINDGVCDNKAESCGSDSSFSDLKASEIFK